MLESMTVRRSGWVSMYEKLSERLMAALHLAVPPVAVSFPSRAPSAMARPATPVAAGCAFWEQGANRAVTTTASDHRFCSIGIHTHNIAGAPDSQAGELQDALAAMQGLDYVRPDEVAALPVMKNSVSYVVYCPLRDGRATPGSAAVCTFRPGLGVIRGIGAGGRRRANRHGETCLCTDSPGCKQCTLGRELGLLRRPSVSRRTE